MVVMKWLWEKCNDNAELSEFQLNKTIVRISDDSPSLSWLPRFAAQVMNKWRSATTERRVKWGELVEDGERKFGFVQLEKTVSVLFQVAWLKESSLVIIIEQEQFCALPRMELCEAKVGRDRHWVMLGNPWTGKVCVALRGKWWLPNRSWRRKSQLTKKEWDLPLPRIVVERAPEVELRRFYVLSADIEAHGYTAGCAGCAALASHGKATKPLNNECRERIRTIIERTLTGKARMIAYKDRIAETQRVKERKRELE